MKPIRRPPIPAPKNLRMAHHVVAGTRRNRTAGAQLPGTAARAVVGTTVALATSCQETPSACLNAIQAAHLDHLAPETCSWYTARDNVVGAVPWVVTIAIVGLAARSKAARGLVARLRAQHEAERLHQANRSEIAVVHARVRECLAHGDAESLLLAASYLANLDTACAVIGDADARERIGLSAAILYFQAERAGGPDLHNRPAVVLQQLAAGLDEHGEAVRAQRTRVFEHFFRILAGDPHANLRPVLVMLGEIAHGEQTPDALIGWFTSALRAVGIPELSESPFARLPQLLHKPPTPTPPSGSDDRFRLLELD